jgi:hypothetical protein
LLGFAAGEAVLTLRAPFDRMAAEHIAYAEVSIMPVVQVERGVPFAELWAGMADALTACAAEAGLTLRLFSAIPRNAGVAAGFATLRLVEAVTHTVVPGIDLAGEEQEGAIALCCCLRRSAQDGPCDSPMPESLAGRSASHKPSPCSAQTASTMAPPPHATRRCCATSLEAESAAT